MREGIILNEKTIFISGSGYAAQAIAKEFLQHNPKKIILYSRNEFKQVEAAKNINGGEKVRFLIGDIRDRNRLYRALKGVDYVIHTAALKRVPECEYNPAEAVKTNILGTLNIIDACIDRGIEKAVLLSTDKAVNPINLYGASKLCADKLWIAGNAYQGTIFAVVRYGNVAESTGSVIPYFKSLVDAGARELPLTSKDMTRFWISIDDAVRLVQEALANSKGGETYIGKIKSFYIRDLITALDCEYKLVGLREGEKLHEAMINEYDNCYDMGWHYIIYSPLEWCYQPTHGIGKLHNFKYESDDNEYITVDELREYLK